MLRLVVLLSAVWCGVSALDNGLARTPPMGWLDWGHFGCNTNCTKHPDSCISEKLFMEMGDRLVADGFRDVGYEYVNIDDCWSSHQRDAQGRLQPDPDRFPSGMKALSDYLHKKGLKLGIYADYGTLTCGGYPGSIDHLQLDAQTFADWGVDMLKMDGCHADVSLMRKGYPEMEMYLNQTGRPILFSCSWPDYERKANITVNYQLVAQNCNIWRNWYDMNASWGKLIKTIDYYASAQDLLAPAQGPGAFNDPDMILAGNYNGFTPDQAQTQMALWAIFSSPLLMSNDLRNLTQDARDVLLNREVIAVNQDRYGQFGKRIMQTSNGIDVWTKPLVGASYAAAIMNRGSVMQTFTFDLATLKFPRREGYIVRDLFLHTDLGLFLPGNPISVTVNPTGVVMLRADPVSAKGKGGRNAQPKFVSLK